MAQSLLAAPNRILPALVTPLTADGEVDLASAERLIDHLYHQGMGGLYVTGSTGEGIYLDMDSRRTMVELAVGMSRGRGQVIAHVRHRSRVGLSPGRPRRSGPTPWPAFRPLSAGCSWDEVYGYYQRLCETSSVPVVGYYIPSLTGQAHAISNLTARAVAEPGWLQGY